MPESSTPITQQLDLIQGHEISESQTFPFSNDEGAYALLPFLQDTMRKFVEPTGKIRTGIVIGNGGVFSYGPELPMVDQWIVIDINRPELQLIQAQANYLAHQTSDAPEDIQQGVQEVVTNLKGPWLVEADFERERRSFGPLHYTASSESIKRTQEFLRKGNISYVGMDMANHEDLTKFISVLKALGMEIVFANFTNIYEHLKDETQKNTFVEGLSQLPFAEGAYVQYSVIDSRMSITAEATDNVSSYINELQLDYGDKMYA